MNMNKLSAGVAVAALVAYGTAGAYTLRQTADSQQLPGVLAIEVELADDATRTTGVELAFDDDVLSDNPIRLDVTLTGATFVDAVTPAALSGCAAGLSAVSILEGGEVGSNTVSFQFSDGEACNNTNTTAPVGDANRVEPLVMNARLNGLSRGVDVSLLTNLTAITQDGVNDPIEGGLPQDGAVDILAFADAFSVVVRGGPQETLFASIDADPAFSTLTNMTTDPVELGTVLFRANTTDAQGRPVSLSPDSFVAPSITYLQDVTYSVSAGDTSIFMADAQGNSKQLLDASTRSFSFDAATGSYQLSRPNKTSNLATRGSDKILLDGVSEVPFPQTSLAILVSYTLSGDDGTVFAEQSPVSRTLVNIAREGTTLTFAWLASGSTASNTTSNNIIRIANISNVPTGAVYMTVLATSLEAYATGDPRYRRPVKVADSIAPGAELVYTSFSLENSTSGVPGAGPLGNFGRGDIEVFVEADPRNITAKRLIAYGDDSGAPTELLNDNAGRADKYEN